MNNYEDYLRSPEWKRKAEKRIQIDRYMCAMCGCEGTQYNPLCIHHFNYRNIGNEDVGKDLVTLCDACHRRVHKMMLRVTDPETGRRGWTDQLPNLVQKHVIAICGERYCVTSM